MTTLSKPLFSPNTKSKKPVTYIFLGTLVPAYRYIDLDNQGLVIIDYINGRVLEELYFQFDSGSDKADDLLLRFKADILKVFSCVGILMDANLVHGDISPKNIVIADNNAFLIDIDTLNDAGADLTKSAPPYYTCGYADSTIVRRGCVSEKADVYSILKMYEYFICGLEHAYDCDGWSAGSDDFVDKAIRGGRVIMPIDEIRDRFASGGNLAVI